MPRHHFFFNRYSTEWILDIEHTKTHPNQIPTDLKSLCCAAGSMRASGDLPIRDQIAKIGVLPFSDSADVVSCICAHISWHAETARFNGTISAQFILMVQDLSLSGFQAIIATTTKCKR